MATISHIPNPTSVSVKTAGYTIPANRYAIVSVNVHAGGTFNIGGVTCLSAITTSWANLASSPLTSATFGSANNLAAQGFSTAGGAAFASSTAVLQTSVVDKYNLPAGTIINGTGTWRAVVEEYGG